MDFKIKDGEQVRTRRCAIASATVIEAGDLVTLTSGLITKAVAASTALGYAVEDSAVGDTLIDVTVGNDFSLVGTADANFAVTDRGITCDLVGTTNQLIDLGTSTTNVLQVGIGSDAGTVGSTSEVEVKINKPLF